MFQVSGGTFAGSFVYHTTQNSIKYTSSPLVAMVSWQHSIRMLTYKPSKLGQTGLGFGL